MMSLQKLSIFATFLFLLTSCLDINSIKGDGQITTKSYDVESFESVEVSGFYEVMLIQGDEESVEVETDQNLLDYIRIFNDGKRLIIESEESLSSDHGVQVTVFYKNLHNIYSSGASEVKSRGTMEGEQLKVNMAGAGAIEVDVDAESLDVNISGAGLIKLSGTTHTQYLDLSGAGKLDAFELVSEECYVNLSGVGEAEVYVTERLNATVSGIGNVKYRGNPQKISQDVSGMGKVKKDDKDKSI